MQFTILALSFFAAAVSAQNSTTSLPDLVSQLPPCALNCLDSSAKTAGCDPADFNCLCGPKRQTFITEIGTCVTLAGTCTQDELNTAFKIAPEICVDVSNNPDPTAVASASNLVSQALASETAQPSDQGGAATRPSVGMGLLGVAALAAALTL